MLYRRHYTRQQLVLNPANDDPWVGAPASTGQGGSPSTRLRTAPCATESVVVYRQPLANVALAVLGRNGEEGVEVEGSAVAGKSLEPPAKSGNGARLGVLPDPLATGAGKYGPGLVGGSGDAEAGDIHVKQIILRRSH